MTALLFGDWNSPVPSPKRARQPSSPSPRAMRRRARAQIPAPRAAGARVPILSERAPLTGATSRTASGKATITIPILSGV